MNFSWELLGQVGTGIGVAITAGWAGWQKWQKVLAERKVAVAENSAAINRAEASSSVFEMVKQQLADVQVRLTQAEHRIDTLRDEVAEKDRKIHSLEMHIRDLEHTMRQHGIDPPTRPQI